MNDEELSREDISQLLRSFTCPKNQDVELFLHSKAVEFEVRDTARTYLMLDDIGQILAYFSLSFKEIELIDRGLSLTAIKKLDGFDKRAERVKAYLIGQIGKNLAIDHNPVDLETILNEVYAVIDEARALVGGRVIILECEDVVRLIQHYERHGFKKIPTHDPVKGLVTMYTVVE